MDAETNFLICLNHFKKQHDRLGQASVLGVLGTLFYKKEDYDSSIQNYKLALDIYKELNQISEHITCMIGIGSSYVKLNLLDKAIDCFLECSAICSDNNDIYNLLECLGNLVIIHEAQEKWDILLELYKKSADAFEEIRDQKGLIISYFNLGIVQRKLNDNEEALILFKKATNFAIDSNYVELILKGLSYVGETYFYLGKLNKAKIQYIKALHLAETINAKNAIIQLKILLNSLGLNDDLIKDELKKNQDLKKRKN